MSTEKEHLAAVVAFLGGSARKTYTRGELEEYKKDNAGALPSSYNEVTVMQRFGDGPNRRGSLSDVPQWRVLVRSVGGPGATGYANAQEMRARASELHGGSLVIAGETYYPRRSATDDPIAPDSGWWSGTSEFIY